MAIDASIYRAQEPPVSPLKGISDAIVLRGQQQALESDAIKLQQQRQAQADQERIDKAWANAVGPDGQINEASLFSHLPGHAVPAVMESYNKAKKSAADYQKAQTDAEEAKTNLTGQILNGVVASDYDPDVFMKGVATVRNLGLIPPEAALQLSGVVNQGKPAIKAVIDHLVAQSKTAAQTNEQTSLAALHKGELPGVVAKSTVEQQVAAGTVGGLTPEQQAQQREVTARLPLLAAQTREATARVPLVGAQTREAQATAKAKELEASQLAAVTGGAPGGKAVADVPVGQKNEEFLATLPDATRLVVKGLAEGRMAFPSGFALRSPYWQGLLQAVAKYDPSFDAVNYNARAKTRADFTSGASSKQINAINTVIGHLDSLSTATDALGNSDYPLFNKVANALSRATGSPKVTNFNTVKKAVSDEVTRVWRQAGGSAEDIKAAQDNLDAAGSPAQLHQAIATYGDLLESKLTAFQSQFQQGMGTSDVQMVTPAARATLNKLEQKAGAAPAAATGAKEGDVKPIPGFPGTEQTYRNGKWIRTK